MWKRLSSSLLINKVGSCSVFGPNELWQLLLSKSGVLFLLYHLLFRSPIEECVRRGAGCLPVVRG